MKIRVGFVSNSSSTSYTVWLPGEKKFKELLDKYDNWKEFDIEEYDLEDVKTDILESVKELRTRGHDADEEGHFCFITEILSEAGYLLGSADGSCGVDTIVNVNTIKNRPKLKKFLEEEENHE